MKLFTKKKKNVFAPDFFQHVSTYTEVHNPHFLKAHEKQRTVLDYRPWWVTAEFRRPHVYGCQKPAKG